MTNFEIIESSHEALKGQKLAYMKPLSAPYDGMWECFLNAGEHFEIKVEEQFCGYFVLNQEGRMLQFNMEEGFDGNDIFSQVIKEKGIKGAFVSTSESVYLKHARDQQKNEKINTLLYEFGKKEVFPPQFPPGFVFRKLEIGELDTAISFAHDAIEADKGWLKGYYQNLLNRKELFGLMEGETIIALGEKRVSDTHVSTADVGMIVGKQYRRKGIATNVLRVLVELCQEENLSPICSAEVGNIGSHKAIVGAGFTSHHKILEIAF